MVEGNATVANDGNATVLTENNATDLTDGNATALTDGDATEPNEANASAVSKSEVNPASEAKPTSQPESNPKSDRLETWFVILLIAVLLGAFILRHFLNKTYGAIETVANKLNELAGKVVDLEEKDRSTLILERLDGISEKLEPVEQGGASEEEEATESPEQVIPTPEIDHSLPLALCDEIERLRTRLLKYGDEDKNKKPMTKALDRLEEKLVELDYERVDLLGKPYRDGMTAQSRFIPSDDPLHRERTITRVTKPEVHFQGKLVQVPEIEVSHNASPS